LSGKELKEEEVPAAAETLTNTDDESYNWWTKYYASQKVILFTAVVQNLPVS
jgi:hypothetical protein